MISSSKSAGWCCKFDATTAAYLDFAAARIVCDGWMSESDTIGTERSRPDACCVKVERGCVGMFNDVDRIEDGSGMVCRTLKTMDRKSMMLWRKKNPRFGLCDERFTPSRVHKALSVTLFALCSQSRIT